MQRLNRQVFINCPFDSEYSPLLEAIAFAISACEYTPRCALEVVDSGVNRLGKIIGLIDQCDFSLHDISRTELNSHGLPRFNMPFELGLALGRKYSKRTNAAPGLLVFDREPYRYGEFLSDLKGCDPVAHRGDPHEAISQIRDWLSSFESVPLNGPTHLTRWFDQFQKDLPGIYSESGFDRANGSFNDLRYTIRFWLVKNVPLA